MFSMPFQGNTEVKMVINGCADCPMRLGDYQPYCWLLKKNINKYIDTVPNNCPLPQQSGFIRLSLHGLTKKTEVDV